MEALQDILVGTLLVSVMLSVGFDLTWNKLRDVWKQPGILAAGLVLNYVLIPLVALGSTRALGVTGAAAIGVLLVSATPGGPFGTLLVQKARGNLPAAVSLMITLTLLNTILTPVVLGSCASISTAGMRVPIAPVARLILLYQVIPLAISMSIRHRKADWAPTGRKLADWTTNIAFVILLIGMVTTEGATALNVGWRTFVAMEILILAMLGIGFFAYPFDRNTRVAFALTNTIRSLGLALLLAAAWFDDMTVTVTAMCYGLMTFVNAIPFAIWSRARADRDSREDLVLSAGSSGVESGV